jgi:hypothetical protein
MTSKSMRFVLFMRTGLPAFPLAGPPTKVSPMSAQDHSAHAHSGPGYASPQAAREQPPEQFVYVAALYEGTGINRPDFIAVVDVDPDSSSYGEIVIAPRCRTWATSFTTSVGTHARRRTIPSSSATRWSCPVCAPRVSTYSISPSPGDLESST